MKLNSQLKLEKQQYESKLQLKQRAVDEAIEAKKQACYERSTAYEMREDSKRELETTMKLLQSEIMRFQAELRQVERDRDTNLRAYQDETKKLSAKTEEFNKKTAHLEKLLKQYKVQLGDYRIRETGFYNQRQPVAPATAAVKTEDKEPEEIPLLSEQPE